MYNTYPRPYGGIKKTRQGKHAQFGRNLLYQWGYREATKYKAVQAYKAHQANVAEYFDTMDTRIFGPGQKHQNLEMHHILLEASPRTQLVGKETNREDIQLYWYKDHVEDHFVEATHRRNQAVQKIGREKSRMFWNQHVAHTTSDTYFGPHTWGTQKPWHKDPVMAKLWQMQEDYSNVSKPDRMQVHIEEEPEIFYT